MTNINLIKELRELTSAGMKNCKDALEEANWDLQKAVDIIKIKGQTVAVSSKIAAEGAIGIITDTLFYDGHTTQSAYMVEVNCNTDFVSKSEEFLCFINSAKESFHKYCALNYSTPWQPSDDKELEIERAKLASTTKENIVIRRWAGEEAYNFNTRVFNYTHPNKKIGAILAIMASSEKIANSKEFLSLGEDLVMQVAAMSPLAVSSDLLPQEELDRQKIIIETQVKVLNKPQQANQKIIEGKLNKWYEQVCLLNQESVLQPKTSIKKVVEDISKLLGGTITVVSFNRFQVGEGLKKTEDNFANEAIQMASA